MAISETTFPNYLEVHIFFFGGVTIPIIKFINRYFFIKNDLKKKKNLETLIFYSFWTQVRSKSSRGGLDSGLGISSKLILGNKNRPRLIVGWFKS